MSTVCRMAVRSLRGLSPEQTGKGPEHRAEVQHISSCPEWHY